jgi:diadenosine tetraphosphatase ApaH/serine/threonine PP2A family protein phosphatase
VRDWPTAVAIDGVLYCHATPASDEGIVLPQWDRSDWSPFTQPFVVCGHTHVQYDIERGTTRVLNPGSVGFPTIRATAWWAVVTGGAEVELRTTDYDTARVARAWRETGFPDADFADALDDPITVERLLELVA